MKKVSFIFLFVFTLSAFQMTTNPLKAQGDNGTAMVKKCTDFELTGDGSSKQWENAPWITIQQRTPQKNTYTTKARVMYSNSGIYVLFDCEDSLLRSDYTHDNEDLWEGDVVEVFLWPGEDFPVYFEYELTPLNYELPIIVPNDKGRFFGWLPWHYEGDRKTRHATSVRGGRKENGASIRGWTAELFIPFKLLTPLPNVPPKSGTTWRANLYRIDHDQGETLFSWQKTDKTYHEFHKFGTFVFE